MDIYEEAIAKWGIEFQLLVLFEEIGELQTVLVHAIRNNRDVSKHDIITEIADVEIMMEEVKRIFNITSEEIEDEKKIKLEKLRKLLDA